MSLISSISLMNNSLNKFLISKGNFFFPMLNSGFIEPKIRKFLIFLNSVILLFFIKKIEFPSRIFFSFNNISSFAKLISSNKIHSSFFNEFNKIPSMYLKAFEFDFEYFDNNLFNSKDNFLILFKSLLLLIFSSIFFKLPKQNLIKFSSFFLLPFSLILLKYL